MNINQKYVGEVHDKLTIIAVSKKKPNGYLPYVWTRCECGNIKRYRYDQARRKGNCGLCEDFTASRVNEVLRNGNV